jgi:hypothetical protein
MSEQDKVHSNTPLFPRFEQFANQRTLVSKLEGHHQVKLRRVLGQGNTKAFGLDLPPAAIERKIDLVSLKLPAGIDVPEPVRTEIHEIESQLEAEFQVLKGTEGKRRLATQVLREISAPNGFKDNHFYAGRLVLVPAKNGQQWSWSLTSHYPIVDKIPPDKFYLTKAFEAAEAALQELILPTRDFENRLSLAWTMARHYSNSDDVLLVDVARMFKIAGQKSAFWNNPSKRNFQDLPDAAFIANLINWRTHGESGQSGFKLVSATMHQSIGPKSKVFFMPTNAEGTQTRPVIHLRRESA